MGLILLWKKPERDPSNHMPVETKEGDGYLWLLSDIKSAKTDSPDFNLLEINFFC
jgi:hypothetical protein